MSDKPPQYKFEISKGLAMYSGTGWGLEDFRDRLRIMAGERRMISASVMFADGTKLEIEAEASDG